jgi:cell division protein FtsB
LAAVMVSYLNPLVNFVHTYRDSGAAKQSLHELQLENRHLHNRVQSADDPGVLEREARRQGMIEPGERPYVVKGLSK